MSTKKLQIIGNLGTKIYTQNDEPADATEGALWVDLDDEGAASSHESLGIINLYVCSDGEYVAGSSPTIAVPDEDTTYLVPQDSEGYQYASWVYANGAWEFVETLTVTLDETSGGSGGLSAYEIAVKNGFDGSEQEWLESLQGEPGIGISSIKQTTTSSIDGGSNIITITYSNGTTSTFTVKNGSKGSTPVKGTDYFTDADIEEMVNAVIAALPVYNGEVEAV